METRLPRSVLSSPFPLLPYLHALTTNLPDSRPIAPEYILDSLLTPSNDLYSLGCLLYAVHLGNGKPPFRCRDSIHGVRECVERELVTGKWMGGVKWAHAGEDLKGACDG